MPSAFTVVSGPAVVPIGPEMVVSGAAVPVPPAGVVVVAGARSSRLQLVMPVSARAVVRPSAATLVALDRVMLTV
jgi:hypothetical protein